MTKYQDAGVDIARGDEAVERLKKHVKKTYTKDVLQGVGAYAGSLSAQKLRKMQHPVLLFTIDGVGTKTLIMEQWRQLVPRSSPQAGKVGWEGIGSDIVHHCANDLVCQGAAPLVFLDYVASSRLEPAIVEQIVAGMSEACSALGCVLIGGETAEMPQVYQPGAHDVVGAMTGIVERDQMITGENIRAGDILIALPSNGLHTNGYSLARKVLLEEVRHAEPRRSTAPLNLREDIPALGCTLGEALLKPHTEYSRLVRAIHQKIGLKGVAHITGSGIPGNLPRILPKNLGAKIEKHLIRVLPIFQLIQECGKIAEKDMYDAFNMGVGMILVVPATDVHNILSTAKEGYVLGEVVEGNGVHIA